ncbi:hypothetical protein SK3146_03419 [Paenibacillus konkukensis]|uniref:Phosphatase n=1 Tax=Paenibacillus konkukensis TaxID=2020716 RepID=A0ABY4RP05_9BACL|nr:alkaline phosphatase PhoX [Paenibacillus konkukensis]UQZ84186.1 hypothetical protein SK3146_03419 [Paenibacillus konkukensis]
MSEKKPISRRTFLAYLGTGAAAIVAASSGLGAFQGKAFAADALFSLQTNKITDAFQPIEPAANGELLLPKGFKAHVLAAYGDSINPKGDVFGYGSSFTRFFPIDGSNVKGLLWVNHASDHHGPHNGRRTDGQLSLAQIKATLANQGASIIEIYRDQDGDWKMDTESANARRITGYDPFELTGPARGSQSVHGAATVQGTVVCGSGVQTLWGTVLCGEGRFGAIGRDTGLDQTHYGWIWEGHPGDRSFQLRKHTALGRFQHGGAAMTLSKNGRVVVYMGGSAAHECIYKFVSKGTYAASAGKANAELLTEGKLYAADLEKGQWIELTIEAVRRTLDDSDFRVPSPLNKRKETLTDLFREQADVLTHAHEAAVILGATPTDRPAGLALHPSDGSLYVSHTSHARHGNIHGYMNRVIEKNGDPGADSFDFDVASAGGSSSGYSCPESMSFDSNGNLWTASDMPADKLNQGTIAAFKNNGLYLLPASKKQGGSALQFASAPGSAHFAGQSFAPDERTLFLSVQQPEPGESAPSSGAWPNRPGDRAPLPAVVAISGFHA